MGRKTALWILVAVGVLAALAGMLIYQQPDVSLREAVGGIGQGLMGIIVLAPLLLMLPTAFAVTLVVWVLRWMGVIGPRAPKDGKSAREILDERFARGEIDQAEYEERKLAISS